MGVEMLMEARVEVSAMTTFSEILVAVDVTALELAHDKLRYDSAAWRLIIPMPLMRRISLSCIVHAGKAATMLEIRLMILGVIGVGRGGKI